MLGPRRPKMVIDTLDIEIEKHKEHYSAKVQKVVDNVIQGQVTGFGDTPMQALKELISEIGVHGWSLNHCSLLD